MSTPEQPTCGKGLAENSVLPAKLGELVAALAENLRVHMKALDLKDQDSQREYDAYEKLAEEYQQIAIQLRATANQMAEYRDLPMGRHDAKAMTHPRVRDAFVKFVQYKRELMALLKQTVDRDDTLLESMRTNNH